MACSAYLLPEVNDWVNKEGREFADFNHCVYADPKQGREHRFKKPQRFVGRLPGLAKLSATCMLPGNRAS